MRINDLLNESIVTNGNDFVAYCIVVAEEYLELPEYDENVASLWKEVASHNEKCWLK